MFDDLTLPDRGAVFNSLNLPHAEVIFVVLGIGCLVAGKKLWWVVIGILGFYLGVQGAEALGTASQNMIFIVGTIAGAIAALLARSFANIVGIIAGFVIGGYIAASYAAQLGIASPGQELVFFILLGIIFAQFMHAGTDFAIIIVTSILGAAMVPVSYTHLTLPTKRIV